VKFWESSALVPLLVEEPTSGQLGDLLRRDPEIALWWGSHVECMSAFCRLQREGALSRTGLRQRQALLDRLVASAFEVEPAAAVRARALRLLATHRLRGADALQLAAALAWCSERPQRVGFVALDNRLRIAAATEGFDVLPYGETVNEIDLDLED
jgi:predicted nucleic acid-binding protein